MVKIAKVHRAIYGSPETLLVIGNRSINCYVLDDGTAVLSGRGMQDALGLGQSHGGKLGDFVSSVTNKSLIGIELSMALSNPIKFTRPGRGGKPSNGYEATILTKSLF